jgi:RNase adapter protein RapZ
VISFLESHKDFNAMYDDVLHFLLRWIPAYRNAHRGYLTIALGCTGGRHRSVCMVEKLATALRSRGEPVGIRHNQLRSLPAG